MLEQPPRHALLSALDATLIEQARVEAYQPTPRPARPATGDTPDRPRPLEFDANGFPITQQTPNFATRVARLLNP